MKLWQRRTLGILTLGGGAVGFAVALSVLLSRTNPIEWFFCIGFMTIYSWGVWCGVRFLESQPGAERSALRYWIIQIPAFGSPILGYALSSGFQTTVALQINPLKVTSTFFLGSNFNYSILQAGTPWFVGANLFAIAVVWWLVRQVPRPAL